MSQRTDDYRALKCDRRIDDVFVERLRREAGTCLIGSAGNRTASELEERAAHVAPERVMTELPVSEEVLGGIGLGWALLHATAIVQVPRAAYLSLMADELHRIGAWKYRTGQQAPHVVFRILHNDSRNLGPELSANHLAFVTAIPGLQVYMPATAEALVQTYDEVLSGAEPACVFELASAKQVRAVERVEGIGKVVILTWGRGYSVARDAAARLQTAGVAARVVCVRQLQPLPTGWLSRQLADAALILVLEPDFGQYQFAGFVAEQVRSVTTAASVHQQQLLSIPPPTFEAADQLRHSADAVYTHVCALLGRG